MVSGTRLNEHAGGTLAATGCHTLSDTSRNGGGGRERKRPEKQLVLRIMERWWLEKSALFHNFTSKGIYNDQAIQSEGSLPVHCFAFLCFPPSPMLH